MCCSFGSGIGVFLLTVYPLLDVLALIFIITERAAEQSRSTALPVLVAVASLCWVVTLVAHVLGRVTRSNFSYVGAAVCSLTILHVFLTSGWGFNILRRCRVCIHILGIAGCYLKLASRNGYFTVTKYASNIIMALYLLGTAYLFRYDAKLRESFILFYRMPPAIAPLLEVVYLVVLVVCAVLLLSQLVSENIIGVLVLVSILCVQVVVDGNAAFWSARYRVEPAVRAWITLMNLPVLATALTMICQTNRKRKNSDPKWCDGV